MANFRGGKLTPTTEKLSPIFHEPKLVSYITVLDKNISIGVSIIFIAINSSANIDLRKFKNYIHFRDSKAAQ